MSDTEINIAIAEACGWTGWCFGQGHSPDIPKRDRDASNAALPPDYCHDLNAMLEAEVAFLKKASLDEMNRWRDALFIAVGLNPSYWQGQHLPSCELIRVATATPRQRAEAFVRTMGLLKK